MFLTLNSIPFHHQKTFPYITQHELNLSIIIIIIMKIRKQFKLQDAQFAEQSDDDNKMISNQLIQMYNKEYSLMLSETKNFFADCKDFLTRFITLNNMGIGFNLPFMLNTILKVQAETVSPTRIRKETYSWQDQKRKFQQNFTSILQKMGDVLDELLNFEIKIKTAYLGEAFNSPIKVKTRLNVPTTRPRNSSIGNIFNSNKKPDQNPEQEKMLRSILQKGMTPFAQKKVTVCTLNSSPLQNLDKLSKKIDSVKLHVQGSKAKQQKIWKIFNDKRPSRNMLLETPEQDHKDNEYKKLNDMLSDMISQKNKNYYTSPYETVDSSFQ